MAQPVAGTVVRAFVVDGTYYSEADTGGAGAIEPQNSQGYLAHVATRMHRRWCRGRPTSAAPRDG